LRQEITSFCLAVSLEGTTALEWLKAVLHQHCVATIMQSLQLSLPNMKHLHFDHLYC